MLGAIIGDISGSRFEFDYGNLTKEFEFINNDCDYTDDSVMTVAIAEGIMNAGKMADDKTIYHEVEKAMIKWGRRYPYAGYGHNFDKWLKCKTPRPYNSYGNGSAMRVSSVAYYYESLARTIEAAKITAEITHNHPEGIKGATCTAAVIYLGRNGLSKEEILKYVLENYDYDLHETIEEMRARHEHVESCMDSLPKALRSFFVGNSYEDVVRNAISLGGDTDTLAAIAGAMAEGYYGNVGGYEEKAKAILPKDMWEIVERFKRETGK